MPDEAEKMPSEADGMFSRMEKRLRELAQAGSLRRLPSAADAAAGLVNVMSNDYLALAGDTELRRSFLERMTPEDFLPSASSSRLLAGNSREYEELESLLATLYRTEAALVFASGYHMNIGILPAIAARGDLILADRLVHASLIDGIRLSRARLVRYRHNDYEHLEELLAERRSRHSNTFVVTESVFSMDGDCADLRRLVELKKRHPELVLYVDEAHAVGVLGKTGLGLADELGLADAIDILAGTLGKALASVGGFIVCRRVLRDYLVNTARPLIFSTGLPPVNLRWTRFVLERLAGYGARRRRLAEAGSLLARRLREKGYAAPHSGHIQPVILGSDRAAGEKATALRERGFLALPVRPPTVPAGTARIRISLTAAMTPETLERLADCF